MALPASGALSLSQVNTELSLAATTQVSLGATNVRSLAGVASGQISMSSLYGKSASPPSITIPEIIVSVVNDTVTVSFTTTNAPSGSYVNYIWSANEIDLSLILSSGTAASGPPAPASGAFVVTPAMHSLDILPELVGGVYNVEFRSRVELRASGGTLLSQTADIGSGFTANPAD